MKKNISINLQGIIFHIEEDGFDVLSRYLAEVKAHFASYRGHEDIVADIEGRIAELFSARLSPTQQVISLDDVQAMTAKMGRVRDFAPDEDEDDAPEMATANAAGATGFGATGAAGTAAAFGTDPATGEPKRLYRDMANRKIAGVAAGLAQYFKVNSLWIRLGFLGLLLFKPLLKIVSLGELRVENGGPPSLAIVIYVILWIALPKHYNTPPLDDNFDFKSLSNGRKFFRDPDNGKVGGVAAGLAPYLNLDVTLIRVLLLIGLFVGGFTVLLYLILWVAAPQAKTVADRMRMRGEDMTLEGFDSNVRNNAFADGTGPAANRPVGAFIEDLGRNLRPLVDFVGSAIRLAAGVLLTIGGFSLVIMLAILLGAGIGLIPNSENIVLGDAPAHVLLNGIPSWAIIAGFITAGIPALWMLLGGLNLLFRRTLVPRGVGLSLLGLWVLGIVGLTMAVAQQSREFQYEATVEQVERYPALKAPVLLLDARHVDREWDQHVNVELAAADSGRVVEVLRTLGAQGPSEEVARRTALTTIDYTVRTSGDSSLVVDDHFSFLPNARFRKQALGVTLRLPRDRTFRLTRRFADHVLDDDNFVGNRRPDDAEQHRYRLRGNKLECIGCTDEQLNTDNNTNTEDENANVNTDLNDDSEDGDDNKRNGLTLNYGGAPSFDTDPDSYGSERRTFDETGFTQVEVRGAYRVVVRRGDAFKVEASGDGRSLKDLKVTQEGSVLKIFDRGTSIFRRGWNNDDDKVLVSITMPAVEALELDGAVQADLSGFERQDRLRVQQAGTSHLRLNGQYGTLKIEQAGACRTTATGRADELELESAGACELAAANLQTRVAKVGLAGICKARLNVSETLKGDAVGASEIAYSGNPKNVKMDATGPSSIKRLK